MAKFDELVDECEEDMFSIIAQDGTRNTASAAFAASVIPQNRGFWKSRKIRAWDFRSFSAEVLQQ